MRQLTACVSRDVDGVTSSAPVPPLRSNHTKTWRPPEPHHQRRPPVMSRLTRTFPWWAHCGLLPGQLVQKLRHSSAICQLPPLTPERHTWPGRTGRRATATPSTLAHRGCVVPSRPSWETTVVSIENCAPRHNGGPPATITTRRLSRTSGRAKHTSSNRTRNLHSDGHQNRVDGRTGSCERNKANGAQGDTRGERETVVRQSESAPLWDNK